MKSTALITTAGAFFTLLHLYAQDFCSNLNTIHNDIAVESSFSNCIGEQTSQSTSEVFGEEVVTTVYEAKQELIPGNAGTIIFEDSEGVLDFWTYEVTTSIVYDKEGQLANGEYWFNTIKECLDTDSGWKFEVTERTYDSEEKVKVWKATKPLETHLGFVHKTISVIVFEERDENLRKTGRYGVRIEIM